MNLTNEDVLEMKKYDNLMKSDEYREKHAIDNLPHYYYEEYKKIYERVLNVETNFIKTLQDTDEKLFEMYQKLDSEIGNLFAARSDAMFYAGATAEHLDLRFQGWRVPLEEGE